MAGAVQTEEFGKLQVVSICFKLGGRENDQSRAEVQACCFLFLPRPDCDTIRRVKVKP